MYRKCCFSEQCFCHWFVYFCLFQGRFTISSSHRKVYLCVCDFRISQTKGSESLTVITLCATSCFLTWVFHCQLVLWSSEYIPSSRLLTCLIPAEVYNVSKKTSFKLFKLPRSWALPERWSVLAGINGLNQTCNVRTSFIRYSLQPIHVNLRQLSCPCLLCFGPSQETVHALCDNAE
jgi:hypothetical protein